MANRKNSLRLEPICELLDLLFQKLVQFDIQFKIVYPKYSSNYALFFSKITIVIQFNRSFNFKVRESLFLVESAQIR